MGRDRLINLGSGGGGVTGLTSADAGNAIADNELIRGDGTTGIQGSTAILTDAGELTLTVADAGTTTVSTALTLAHTTSGTAAAGLGTGILFQIEDAGGTLENACSIEAQWIDAGAASEDSELVFKARAAGASPVEVMTVGHLTGVSNYGTIWLGNVTPSGTNYVLTGQSAGESILNGVSQVDLRVSNTTHLKVLTTATTHTAIDAGTTTVLYPAVLDRQSSGTPAAGIGSGLAFDVETAAGNTERGATIEAVTTDVTSTSEDFDLVFKTMAAGAAAAEAARFLSTGGIKVVAGSAANPSIQSGGNGFYSQGNGDLTFARSATAIIGLGVGANVLGLTDVTVLAWNATLSGAYDTGIGRVADGVVGATLGTSGAGWFQNEAGDKRLTANVTENAATMTNLTDLTVTVAAGRKYTGKMVIYCVDSTAAEGLKFDFDGGTATMTSFRAHGTLFDTGLLLSTQTTALATDFAAATVTGDSMFEVHFSFVVNGAGTFIPRFSQNTHAVGTATAYLGSYIQVSDSFN